MRNSGAAGHHLFSAVRSKVRASGRLNWLVRGPIRSPDGADDIGTGLMLELPDRAAADTFWNEEPLAKNGGDQGDARIVRWVFGDEKCQRRG